MEKLTVEKKEYTFASSSEPFQLESGECLTSVTIAYETWGELSAQKDNTILVFHALTGSAHVTGMYENETRPSGWWDPLIGPGRAIDTNKYFVICANVLGGCYGSTGPTSINPKSNEPYGMDFPIVTIRDMVKCQKVLLDYLEIKQLVAVIGGSMGGMQALEWGVTYPGLSKGIVSVAACGRLYPQAIAYNSIGRQAICSDPNWNQGNYYPGLGPVNGLALARMIGTITYKCDQTMNYRFGRQLVEGDEYYSLNSRFEVESYLNYHGSSFIKRFDANTYIYLTKAMDLYDVSYGRNCSYEEVVGSIKAKFLAIGIDSDILFPTYQQKELVEIIQTFGGSSSYLEIKSPHGHDAFLIEFKQLAPMITNFLHSVEEE